MDLIQTCHTYVTRLMGDDKANSKIKILLLDRETTAIISMCTTQSVLLKHEIYLVDRLENNREKMRNLKCLVFVRPSSESISGLIEELRHPKYSSYELFFSNVVKKSQLERVAESDDHEIVTKVQELFADYLVVNSDLFSMRLQTPESSIFNSDGPDTWTSDTLQRSVEGVVAVLLSLKLRPLIRLDGNSRMARKLASDISFVMAQDKVLFDSTRRDTPPILLLLDRRNDPLTPLLTPWTYQAMVHDLLGINNNRVDLGHVPDVRPELSEIVLSSDSDSFFKKSMYLNFGDLGASIKDYVDLYQSRTKSSQTIESIADMKRFVEDYPEFRRLSGNVSKHVTLVSELSRRVNLDRLLDVSQLEQSLACNDSHSADLATLRQFLLEDIPPLAKIRLVALYGLHYESHSNSALKTLVSGLEADSGVPSDLTLALKTLLNQYAGTNQRSESLFQTGSIFTRAQSGLKGLKGVENVYTQHTPLLERTLTNLIKGRLKKSTHPYYDPGDGSLPGWTDGEIAERPQDIVVFMIGGATFEEARLVAEMNASTPGVRIVLGGTTVHNAESFLRDVADAGIRWPRAPPSSAVDRVRARVGA